MSRRPPRFHQFIGHKKQVDLLRRQLDGAVARNEPFPHALFRGPSGVGKTLLAESVAAEFETDLEKLTGYASPRELAAVSQRLNKADFLFVDESHTLKPESQELLYRLIDEQKVPLYAPNSNGDEGDGQLEEVEVRHFSILLASDQPGRLLNGLRKRLPVQISLGYYRLNELKEIVDQQATSLNLLISPHVARLIASVSGGLPRRAKHHLQNLRLHFPKSEAEQISLLQARQFLHEFGIDAYGLGPDERRYLRFLRKETKASLETLALYLGLDHVFVRCEIEAMLTRQGLISIGSGGRKLTSKGQEWTSRHPRKRSYSRQTNGKH